ncbi:MAG: ATP-binding protein, partial [Myxococcota bacterium]
LELAPTDADLHGELKTVRDLFSPVAAEKGVQVVLHIGPEVPRFAHFDGLRLRQALNNLVSNAVKFTPRGEVRILTGLIDSNRSGEMMLEVAVDDDGPGIPEDALGQLFDRFQQVDAARDARSGTGLGLSITLQLAQLMGGGVDVSSVLGKGSTFRFRAEIKSASEEFDAEHSEADAINLSPGLREGKRLRALVVDDVSTNRVIARAFLRSAGFDVELAEDGRAALERFRAETFDLVLMDSSMPGMSGTETLTAMHESGRSIPPVIAVTADAMEGDRERYLGRGFVGYVSKPIDRRFLIGEIARVTRPRRSPPA